MAKWITVVIVKDGVVNWSATPRNIDEEPEFLDSGTYRVWCHNDGLVYEEGSQSFLVEVDE